MALDIDTVIEIDTPEHVVVRTRIAGPARRLAAWLIDLMVRFVLFGILAVSVGLLTGQDAQGFGQGFILLVLFGLDWGYFTLCEVGTGGRSAGKMMLGLRVVRPNGLPITWRHSILRNFVRFADVTLAPPVVLLLGPLVMAIDEKFRRLGDMVAGTIVVLETTPDVHHELVVTPDSLVLAGLPGRLPLDRGDLEAVELFVHRPHMGDARQRELARLVAPVYADRLGRTPPDDPTAFPGALWVRTQSADSTGPSE